MRDHNSLNSSILYSQTTAEKSKEKQISGQEDDQWEEVIFGTANIHVNLKTFLRFLKRGPNHCELF